MTAERQDVLSELESLIRFLKSKPPNDKVTANSYQVTKSILRRADEYAVQYVPSSQRGRLMELYDKLIQIEPLSFGEASGIAIAFRAILMPYLPVPERRIESEYTEGKLARRITELEAELAHMRNLQTNPALEKKVAKLEEEVRKVRFASVVGENEGKEQEDILKKYKAAERKLFVIMPFTPLFDDVWKGGIERACNTEGLVCLRVDQISLSTWITEDIEKYIEMADIVISDITGSNPNVMFELGWALAKGKKPIVIRQQNDPNQVPFDVHNIRYIPYINSWNGIESLFKQICKFIKSTSEIASEKPSKKEEKKKESKK